MNWGFPLKGYVDYTDRRDEQNQKAENFFNSYISYFKNTKMKSSGITMYHGGNLIIVSFKLVGDYITGTEIKNTFWEDVYLAIGSLIVIFVFLWLNMVSLFLATAGLIEIVLSFPA